MNTHGMKPHGMHTYHIQLHGQAAVSELNPMSPHQMTIVQSEPSATLISICTDQAGLLGTLRHLHNLGFVLLAVACQQEPSIEKTERKET
jgi:hypothetical protein